MTIRDILRQTAPQWLDGTGPAADVVVSSRVRLARNLADVRFQPRQDTAESQRVVTAVEEALPELRSGGLGNLALIRLEECSPLERQALVEKHLISPQHARQEGAAVVVRDDEAISVMVNEEDHLRIQCLAPGFQPEAALDLADRVDDLLERRLDYAFSEDLGYLTTCPTNVGTGLRVSVMVHLPGLVHSQQVGPLLNAIAKVGVVARGLYGEGTDAKGNLFQISNQITLGQTEREILVNLKGVCQQVIDRERSARERLLQEARTLVEDRVYRAYGILTNARQLTSDEAMRLLSDLRLGVDLNLLPQIEPRVCNELVVQIGPACLQ
ncbi:MAG: protein arginine kinase, partial [Clostridia bacterium]|nr:protein arginine kinase [Clostridia bacterium]